jgi:hypothetical protein
MVVQPPAMSLTNLRKATHAFIYSFIDCMHVKEVTEQNFADDLLAPGTMPDAVDTSDELG